MEHRRSFLLWRIYTDSVKIKTRSAYCKTRRFYIGGLEGDRTLDLCVANAALSQLSYKPMEILVPVTGVEPVRYCYHRILSFHLPFTSNHSTSLQITFHHSEITQYRRFRTIKFQKWRFSAVSKTHQKCLEKEFFGRKLAELDFR